MHCIWLVDVDGDGDVNESDLVGPGSSPSPFTSTSTSTLGPIASRPRDEHRRAVGEHLGHALRELGGVVAHADDGVRADLLGVLDHGDVRIVPGGLADLGVLGDVATREGLEAADDAGADARGADDDAAHDAEVPRDHVPVEAVARRHDDALRGLGALAVGSLRLRCGHEATRMPGAGNLAHMSFTSAAIAASPASSAGALVTRSIHAAMRCISAGPMPRLVTDGVPMRTPGGSNGSAL